MTTAPSTIALLQASMDLHTRRSISEMHGLGTLLACAHMVRRMFSSWGTDGEPVFSKGDHEKAYRQWPVSPEDYALLVTLVWSDMVGHSGGFEAYAHRALPFGALAAVIIYTCISQGVCHILRRIFAIPQLAYVDDFLRCSIRKWANSQEMAFRRVHGFIGIPLKVGKEDVSQCIEALGHIISAQALWAGLRMTEKRRESVLSRVSSALLKGFEDKEVEEITGHLNFALMATAGKTMFSFARTLYDAVPGPIGKQKPQVYRALLWLEAVLQNPPPRVETDNHGKHHVLLPDGYWDPDKQTGGVGAVLLREGATPFTYGGMIPPHLSYVLLSMQEESKEKKQRNTQAELLAILMAILMWHE